MSKKAIYQVTARQILILALGSALFAAGVVALLMNFSNFGQANNPNGNVLAESETQKITDPSTVSDEQNSIEVYQKLSPGVAFITTSATFENFYGEEFERERGNGSGSVIDRNGHILTNFHVIEGASKLTVSFGGDKVYPATVIGGDPDTDLAIIKITPPREGLTVIPLGDSDKLNVGQKVLAIGNPFGLDRTLTTGIISGLQRPIRARNNRPIDAAIQTDASINPGNSGGPLLDKFGNMIGINSQILSPSGASAGVGFAVPVNTAKRVIPQILQFGEVRRPKLGASLYSIEELRARSRGRVNLPLENGLLISRVLPGGSVDRAGLRGLSQVGEDIILGDIIISIDKKELNNIDDLYRYLDKKEIGDTVQVEVFRDGKTVSVPVKLLPVNEQPARRSRS